MTPSTINHARKILSRGHNIASIVHWIYRPLLAPSGRFSEGFMVNESFTALKWIPGVVALIPTITFSARLGGEPKSEYVPDNSELDNWSYLKPFTDGGVPSSLSIRTNHVNLERISSNAIPGQRLNRIVRGIDMLERRLEPKFLCYLDKSRAHGFKTMKTEEWNTAKGNGSASNYIFISYTRDQFCTQLSGDPKLPEEETERNQRAADRDTSTLASFAVSAATVAGVEAFWIDFECIEQTPDNFNEEVYHICDIVRGAYSLVIIVGPHLLPDKEHDLSDASGSDKAKWLHDWGERLWTVPEALLCSTKHPVAVYFVGTTEPDMVARRKLAIVWDDAGTLLQLIDYYESNVDPGQLEFISIALECFQRRQTARRTDGDVAYALMGLLRRRPKVDKQNSFFEAFARVVLANDSGRYLERLLCLRPSKSGAPWYDMRDVWNARLFDIDPLCQISNIVDKDILVLGGARGALVNWSYLTPVDYAAGPSQRYSWTYARQGPVMCMASFATLMFLASILLYVTSTNITVDDKGKFGAILALTFTLGTMSVLSFILALFGPSILRRLFSQLTEDTQARFFGIEGHPELEHVERILFGRDQGRIQWVSSDDPEKRLQHAEQDDFVPEGDRRRFTLIDTLSLTAMCFTAKKPPNIAMACGKEHGLVRAVLCSYDAALKTFTKEGVLRMKMTVLDQMPQMGTIHFKLTSENEVISSSGEE